jgi:hypothetical protein
MSEIDEICQGLYLTGGSSFEDSSRFSRPPSDHFVKITDSLQIIRVEEALLLRIIERRYGYFCHFCNSESRKNRIWVKSCLLCNLEDFNFFDLEKYRTRENDLLGQSGVVDVRAAQMSVTVSVCVAVIINKNAIEIWITIGTILDCLVLVFGLQRKFLRRNVVRILQREKKTFLTVIRFPLLVS